MDATTSHQINGEFDIEENDDETILRVKGSSNPQILAGAISHAIYDYREVTLRAIGAGAVNQAVKACAIARGYVAPRAIDLYLKPGFTTVLIGADEMSAIVLRVIVKH